MLWENHSTMLTTHYPQTLLISKLAGTVDNSTEKKHRVRKKDEGLVVNSQL